MAQDGYSFLYLKSLKAICNYSNCIPVFPQSGLQQILCESFKSKACHYALKNNVLGLRDMWMCKERYTVLPTTDASCFCPLNMGHFGICLFTNN